MANDFRRDRTAMTGRGSGAGNGAVRTRGTERPQRRTPGASFPADGSGRRRDRGPSGKPAARRGISARDVALQALEDVVREEAYAAQALDRRLGQADLKSDDRRLAANIFYTAVENRLYLQHMLSPFLEKRPEPLVEDILHIAAAQLLFLDRVPDHAAVDEAVRQTRAARREGYTGLVNGVLRNLIRARDAKTLALPDRQSSPLEYLSVRYSLAEPAARRLIDAYGYEEAERIAAWTPPRREQTVRPNRLRMQPPAFEAWLDAQNMTWRRGVVEDAYILTDAGSLSGHAGYREGLFSIQGQSAMLAARAVEARPGMQILDACAAPGGKTCLMAERMGTSGRVYAWDVHEHRVELIRSAARRLGLENVRPVERDARKLPPDARLSMDAVLVDAPCSGLGVIAEKPDIRYRQSEEGLCALPKLQRQILESCAEAVKVGGLLVYATCTVLPEENEALVQAFLRDHPMFEPCADDDWLPPSLRVRYDRGMIRILPPRDALDGFFIARMRRKGL